ncbi:uncharacterized protein LOC134855009 [Symsagittifera roscoffensis]|uniref:uncharacterized protein LOC134855009 n=1 Tax=Symsagittifera roscoffensis TaxID=84072 RepID=UPI00307BE59A
MRRSESQMNMVHTPPSGGKHELSRGAAAEREMRTRQRKEMEEEKLRRIWEEAQRSKEEAREAKREIQRQKDIRMAEIKARWLEKQKERDKSFQEMMEERREAERETAATLEKIRRESEMRRHTGYWQQRPNFSQTRRSLQGEGEHSGRHNVLDPIEESRPKVDSRQSRRASAPPPQKSNADKVSDKNRSSDGSAPKTRPKRFKKRSASASKARKGSGAEGAGQGVDGGDDGTNAHERSVSAPPLFSDVAKRLMFAKRRYSTMRLKTAVARKMRSLMMAEKRNMEEEDNRYTRTNKGHDGTDFEKPNIRAIDVGDLLLSETSESEYGGGLKARDYRGGSKGTSDPSDTLTALRVLNRERGSSVLSSNGVSVELDQFIGPRDCEDILQRTINKIKNTGLCGKIADMKSREGHMMNLRRAVVKPHSTETTTGGSNPFNRYQELERLNHFLEQLMDKMRDCPIEDENKINIVEITDQIVRYLSEEEFHMFRFCLGLQIDHAVPPKLEEHTRLFSRLLLVSARLLKKIFTFFRKVENQSEIDDIYLTEKKRNLQQTELDQGSHRQ